MESTAAVRRGVVGGASAEPANAVLIAAAVLALAWELVGLPLLWRATEGGATGIAMPVAATSHVAMFALTLVPVVLVTPIHWGLIHEGIHGQLLRGRRVNEWVSRALAIGLALPFDAVRFGHLMHHRFTREPFDCPDVDDARGPRWRRRLAYYARLLGGLYAAELLVPLVAFLPARAAHRLIVRGVGAQGPRGAQVQRLFGNHVADAHKRYRARRDWLCSCALYALAFALYAKAWLTLLAAIYLRGLWLSLVDNLPHYGVALDEPGRARDFRVPRGVGALLMNHHLHRQHHLHPTLPWTALPALAEADGPGHGRPAWFRAALRQFRGLQPRPEYANR